MVPVEEIDYIPEFIEEIREETGTAARRFHKVLQRARTAAERNHVELHPHILARHPVRDIIELATELKVDLLVIGSRGRSAIYERLMGEPSQSDFAAPSMPSAAGEVTDSASRPSSPVPKFSLLLTISPCLIQAACLCLRDRWTSSSGCDDRPR